MFHTRPNLILAGSLLFAMYWIHQRRLRRSKSGLPLMPPLVLPAKTQSDHFGEGLHFIANQYFYTLLALLVVAFGWVTSAAKSLQLYSLVFSGQDFWLFQDMLEQMKHGGWFITRYAPQAVGWVQHGAVHPMFSWALALPLSYALDSTRAAVLFGPIVFSAAAWMLALIARPHWGSLGALSAATAFLASSQVARILMYEVHPEAAYPLCVFLWAWAAGWGDGKLRTPILLVATALTMGIKEDSFTVLPPLIAATALRQKGPARNALATRTALLASATLALAITAFQFYAVHQWTHSAWGPHTWQGTDVIIPHAAAPMGQHHWDGPLSALKILQGAVDAHGGYLGALREFMRFLGSRPFVSLLVVAPWVLLQSGFWISTLPLIAVYSLLDDPGKWTIYYSAPILGAFWLAAISTKPRAAKRPSHRVIWLLCAALMLGGSGIDFHLFSLESEHTRIETTALVKCLPEHARGVVSSRLIGLVPEEKILSDRPNTDPKKTDFYLISRLLPSFEMPSDVTEPLIQRLKFDSEWVQYGKNCQPGTTSAAPLFIRKKIHLKTSLLSP